MVNLSLFVFLLFPFINRPNLCRNTCVTACAKRKRPPLVRGHHWSPASSVLSPEIQARFGDVINISVFYFTGAYALGSIDPSLYRISDEDDNYEIPPEHLGRIWFAVEYERETEKLLVTLIKARNLPNRAFGGTGGCDPFVRYLYIVCLTCF